MPAAQMALWRIAWRDRRINRGRSRLVLAMIIVPILLFVAGGTLAAVITPSLDQAATSQMGQADAFFYGDEETFLSATLPPGVEWTGLSVGGTALDVDGSILEGRVIQADFAHPLLEGMLRLEEGRMPTAPGEVAISPELAEKASLGIGDVLAAGGSDGELEVVGIALDPEGVASLHVAAVPGTYRAEEIGWSALVGLGPDVTADEVVAALGTENGYSLREDTFVGGAVEAFGGGLVLTTAALFGTGLIISAAFGVGVRRQLRMLGLLGAVGADTAHIRRLIIANGTVLGFLGAAVGAGVGLVLGMLIPMIPAFRELFDRQLDAPSPSVLLVIGAILLGTIAASIAAAVPARAAARISVIDALAERMPAGRPAGRSARIGLVLVAGGAALMAYAAVRSDLTLVALALVVMLVGFFGAIPLLVTWLARLARHLPMEERIAARSTARHSQRTAAALAAAILAMAFPIAVGVLTLSMEAFDNQQPALAQDQVHFGLNAADASPEEVISEIEAVIPGSESTLIRNAVYRPDGATEDTWGWWGVLGYAGAITEPDGTFIESGASVIIGDAQFLRVVHAEDGIAALEAGKAVGLNVHPLGQTFLEVELEVDPARVTVPVDAVGLDLPYGCCGQFSYWVISEDTASRLGVSASEEPWAIMRAPREVTTAELNAIADVTDSHGLWSYGFLTSHRADGALRTVITAISAAVALGVLALTVALVAAESRREQAMLVAIGADPGSRRRIVGSAAGTLAAVAAVVAVPAGILPVAVALMYRPAAYPVVVPWSTVALVAIGIPLIAGFAAALLTRTGRIERDLHLFA